MKRHLLIVIAAFACMMSSAQDYQPMLKEGKTWVTGEHFFNIDYSENFSYTVCGDTLIDGRTCKKVRREKLTEIPTPCGMATKDRDVAMNDTYMETYEGDIAMYEEDRKVYFYNATDKRPQLLFDFSLHKGDEVSADGSRIIAEDSIMTAGKKFRRLVLSKKVYEENECWVEGVGPNFICLETASSTKNTGPYCVLPVYCCSPDEFYFSEEDFSKEPFYTGIRAISTEQCRTSGMYDISGRRINAPHKGDVYIKEGKKRVEK